MWLNRVSAFIARYKGLPILIAVALVILNFFFRLIDFGWLGSSDFLLHLGVVVGLIGVLLADALG